MAGPQFTEEQIRRALLTLAKHAGNSVTATRDLATQGLELSDRTLRDWKTEQYPDLYRELHDKYSKEIEAALSTEFRELAQAAATAARLAVDKTVAQLNTGEHKNPSGAARDLTITAATSMDKLYLATDRPTHLTDHRNADEVLKALEARYGPNTVNSTATEDEDPAPLLPESAVVNARELPTSTG